MKRSIVGALVATAGLLIGVQPSEAGTIIFSQPASVPLANAGTWASQNDPGGFGLFAETYDNFMLSADARIDDVHWYGQYFQQNVDPEEVQVGNITAFTLSFYSDNGGEPGALLLSQSIAGTANETSLGLGFLGPVFSYDLDLSTSFFATAGTTYWLSIVPDMEYQPQWGWHVANVDGSSVQDFFGERNFRNTDQVFSLTTTVPEPATLLLLGTGLAAAGVRRRMKKRG